MSTPLRTPDVAQSPSLVPAEALPRADLLVTEDDIPVDNLYSEKQQRLLTEPLYSSWPGPGGQRRFLAAANVGLFYAVRQPPLVPDVFLSLDVAAPADFFPKSHRSYFFWEFGKAPEAVIEVVSNLEGEEAGDKLRLYAQIGILYYVIWDPFKQLGSERLRIFVLRDKAYVPLDGCWLPAVNLGLAVWHGEYERAEADWLRWCNQQGQAIPTGAERAEQLAAQLRALGVEPGAEQTKNGV